LKEEIIYCPKRDCEYTNCLRFHKNAPWGVEFRRFNENPKISKNEKCKYFVE